MPVSKVPDIKIIETENYTAQEKSICYNYDHSSCVYLLFNDEVSLNYIKETFEKKKIKTEKKLQDLMKSISKKKYTPDEEETLKDQKKVRKEQLITF